ncbi:MAG: right-handed parallel beta-helix repeat-containing protein, partial [Cyclobacteriaceae bacterium]
MDTHKTSALGWNTAKEDTSKLFHPLRCFRTLLPTTVFVCLMVICVNVSAVRSQTLHVAKNGADSNTGTENMPLLTISKAAEMVAPGSEIIIHEGTYREYVNPSVSGTPSQRITFRAAEEEEVYIKGSEEIDSWEQYEGNTWRVTLEDDFFNGYNPYTLRVDGDFQNYGQWHHRGDVYLNNNVLNELQTLDQVKAEPFTWYTEYGSQGTVIYANFAGDDPNIALTEINVRELLFFPTAINIDFITLSGLRFLHAAPNWQAPNVGSSDPNPLTQKGAIGSKMGKGWRIENCEIMYSKTAGIMMGETFDDQSSFENIEAFGDHLIQNNLIHKCGQYGIAGQKGMTRTTVRGNVIRDINFRNEFGGYEPAGIKIWNCVDVLIENNLISNVIANQSEVSQAYCIWIDYANQGTRITRNVLIGSPMTTTTLFLEANLGPTLVDNNVFIEENNKKIFVFSAGSVFAHNLFINAGFLFQIQEFDNGGSGARLTYSFLKHTLRQTNPGTPVEIEYNQLYNNIFARGAGPIDFGTQSGPGNLVDHNIYMGGTGKGSTHTNAIVSDFNFQHSITETDFGIDLSFTFDGSFKGLATPIVNPELIGQIPYSGQSIADKFGDAITVDKDFNYSERSTNPIIGPLATLKEGTNMISIGTVVIPTEATVYDIPNLITRVEEIIAQRPFNDVAISLPGIIEAEEFDVGGPDISYADDDT